jgi:biotin transport system substrate-specific component
MEEIVLARPAAESRPQENIPPERRPPESRPNDGPQRYRASKAYLAPLAMILVASGLVAICAQVTVPLPFTPVPLSLAPWAVLFLGLTLRPSVAFAALSVYLLEGAAGLPVFSPHGPPGILHLLGPTGGYLLSYPFAAAFAGLLDRRAPRLSETPSLSKAPSLSRMPSLLTGVLAAGAGGLLILIAGAVWLQLTTRMAVGLVLAQAVLPFLLGDVLKVCLAAAAARLVGRIRPLHLERPL